MFKTINHLTGEGQVEQTKHILAWDQENLKSSMVISLMLFHFYEDYRIWIYIIKYMQSTGFQILLLKLICSSTFYIKHIVSFIFDILYIFSLITRFTLSFSANCVTEKERVTDREREDSFIILTYSVTITMIV